MLFRSDRALEEAEGLMTCLQRTAQPQKRTGSLMDQLRQAVADFSQGSESGATWPATIGYRDVLEYVAEYSDEADMQERTAEHLEELDPDSPWSDYGYALAALNRDQFERAVKHAEAGLEKDDEMIELYMVKADAQFENEAYRECTKTCDDALKVDPDHRRARELRRRALNML
mgnify:FL=1